MDNTKLSSIEAILFILTVITNKLILNLPKYIITQCGSSAWLNIIYISLVAIIFTFIIVKLFKKFENCDILDVSKYIGGTPLKTVLRYWVFSFIYFYCKCYYSRFFGNIKNHILP